MKLKTFITKLILPVTLKFLLSTALYSQGTDYTMNKVEQKKIFLGISLNGSQTSISNDLSFLSITSKMGKSLNGRVEVGYFFTRMIGISIGLGYSSYSSQLFLNKDTGSILQKDSENEDYIMKITGKSISEDQKISFLNIPVCLDIRLPLGQKLGFFIQGGINFGIPLDKTYNTSGIFTYEGEYYQYPVLLHDIPKFGFATDTSIQGKGNFQLKSINTSILAVAGINYSFSETLSINLGIQFTRSFANISDYKNTNPFILSTKINVLNSFMAGSSNSGFHALGLSLGLKYYIK